MLELCYYNKKNFHFVSPAKVNESNNVFTILVGRNGTGKSRLLTAIAQEFISLNNKDLFLNENMLKLDQRSTINYTTKPSKVITVSTSPFDRFPVTRKAEKLLGYSYLGLRDLPSQNFGMAYMSKIITSLLEAIIDDNDQMNDIADVLHYLGYNSSIALRFDLKLPIGIFRDLLTSDNPVETFGSILSQSYSSTLPFNKKFFLDKGDKLEASKVYKFISVLKDLDSVRGKRVLRFAVNKTGLSYESLLTPIAKELVFLINSGIIRLREVTLEKINSKTSYSISEASSGEQAVVLGFLGIASQIENNSLICIDEPEICLHPAWQEKYITLLINTFRRYRGCHFIIATHSPQIISNLESTNCFVLSMDTGLVSDANEYIHNSVDFQLASVFNSPGFKNEYLSRIAFGIFTKVSARKKFDEDDFKDYEILISQEKFLDKNDPVYTILTAIKKMHKEYGRHK